MQWPRTWLAINSNGSNLRNTTTRRCHDSSYPATMVEAFRKGEAAGEPRVRSKGRYIYHDNGSNLQNIVAQRCHDSSRRA